MKGVLRGLYLVRYVYALTTGICPQDYIINTCLAVHLSRSNNLPRFNTKQKQQQTRDVLYFRKLYGTVYLHYT